MKTTALKLKLSDTDLTVLANICFHDETIANMLATAENTDRQSSRVDTWHVLGLIRRAVADAQFRQLTASR